MTVLSALQAIPSWPIFFMVRAVLNASRQYRHLKMFLKILYRPRRSDRHFKWACRSSTSWDMALKKKLDFQKNVKVHILKKANYIEVLRLFYLQKQVFLVNLVQILWIYAKKIQKKYWPCVHYFLTPYHIEKITKNGLIKPSRSWQIESFIPSWPWIHLKAKKNRIFKNFYHLVQNYH